MTGSVSSDYAASGVTGATRELSQRAPQPATFSTGRPPKVIRHT